MNIDPKYLEMSFETTGIRDSQKRLKVLIAETAVTPLEQYQQALNKNFDLVDEIVRKRVANVIAYWCQHKHVPVSPSLQDMMSEITNATKNDIMLETFYLSEVKSAMYTLGPTLHITVPDDYMPKTDELEFALLELEEKNIRVGVSPFAQHKEKNNFRAFRKQEETEFDEDDFAEYEDYAEAEAPEPMVEMVTLNDRLEKAASQNRPERAIVAAQSSTLKDSSQANIEIQNNVLSLSGEEAWNLIYGLIGYTSPYVQQTMLPRWQQNPIFFEEDRRFLYGLFIDTIRNAAGIPHISGSFVFSDRRISLDQLWTHYFSDLSQKIAPQLAAARLNNAANDPWHKKLRQSIAAELKNTSVVWLLALTIALIFDGLTTFISLDQTPMEGSIVVIFSVLITALFQIADQLVINYRQREFEAEAVAAKYKAQTQRLIKAIQELSANSDSYVQLSMDKSKAHADWKAAEDSRKMARRGCFWSGRIADINILVTAYGFAYLFLNSEEPMAAIFQQFDIIFVKRTWEGVDLWVFLMVALAITISFVVNTAQRTEILGWSMRRMKREG